MADDNPFAQWAPPPPSQAQGNPFAEFAAKPTAPPPEPRDAGILSALPAGIARSVRETAQTAQVAAGEHPEPLPEEGTLASQPVTWSDIIHPGTLGEKALYGLGHSAPSFAAGIAGATAGSALAGGPESPTGLAAGLAGGALGAAAGTMVQEIGPRFAEELHQHPDDPDGAFNRAIGRAAGESAVSGVAWAAFGIAPFKGAVRNILFQAFGVQPGVAAGARAAENVVEGQPVGTGVAEAIPGAIVGTVVPMAGHEAARRLIGQPEAQAAPAPPQEGLPEPGSTVGFQWGEQSPARVTIKGYEDNGKGVRVVGEDGGERLMATADLTKGLVPAPQPERPQLEGEPASLQDIEKLSPPLEDLETSSILRAQARAAGQTPQRFEEMQREAQAKAATPLLDEQATRALDFANREEQLGMAALQVGKEDEARGYFQTASMLRTRYGAQPGGIPTPQDLAAATAAREQAGLPEIMGQRVPWRQETPPTPEEPSPAAQEISEAAATGEELQKALPELQQRAEEAKAPEPPTREPTAPPALQLSPEQTAAQDQMTRMASDLIDKAGPQASYLREALPAEPPAPPPEPTPPPAPPPAPAMAEPPPSLPEKAVPVSARNVPGEPPIVRFRKDAAAIEATLPPPQNGFTRLWRGNRPGEVGTARQFTNDLAGIALPFREPYGGDISYVDVPTPDLAKYENKAGAAPGAEFLVPPEIGATARPVRVQPEALPAPGRSVRGQIEQAIIPSTGRTFPVTYEIRDVHDLIPSHNDDLSPNPDYPQALQPRQRERAESEAQIRSILNGGAEGAFRPELLGETPDAANGAPIVGADGLVEGGNARTMALRRAYDQGMPQADAYRQYLGAQGYPIEGVSSPVLVRVNQSALDMPGREQLARDLNIPAQAAMSASEQAMADSRQIPPDILRLYGSGDIFSAANQPLVRAVLRSISTTRDLPALTDPEGGLSRAGQQRVLNALLAKAYGDPRLVAALSEDADSNIKSIGNALSDASPAWAQMRNAVAEGRIPQDLDVTSGMIEAVRLIAHARETRRNVAEFMNQRGLFGEDVSPEARDVLSWFLGAPDWTRRYGRDKIADAITDYAQSAQRDAGLLGGERPSSRELIESARERAQGATRELLSPEMGFAARPDAVRTEPGENRPEAQGPGPSAPRLETSAGGARAGEPGAHTDTLADYREFSRAGIPENTPVDVNLNARDYVAERGRETGNEYYAVYDPRTGAIITAGTSNKPHTTTIQVPLGMLQDPASQIVVHHNHPSDRSLSDADVTILSNDGVSWIVAHTHEGEIYAAKNTPEIDEFVAGFAPQGDQARNLAASFVDRGFEKAYDAAVNALAPSLKMQIRSGKIDPDDAETLAGHLVIRALDAAGLVDYVSTRTSYPLSAAVQDSVVKRAAIAARKAAVENGLVTTTRPWAETDYRARIDRSAVPVRPDQAIARISGGADQPVAEGAAGAGAGREGTAGAGATAEERNALVERRLAQPDPAFERPTTPAPQGTDYVDRVTEEIGRETGGKGPGTYARDLLNDPGSRAGRAPFRFNILNGFAGGLIFPMRLASLDARSAQKISAEMASKDQHTALVRGYQKMLPTYLGLNEADRATLNKAAELYRMTGTTPVFDGRTLVIENTGQKAQWSKPGERVYLDTPQLATAAKELHDTLYKAWSDIIEGTTRKFGWQGTPTAEAIRQQAQSELAVPVKRNWNELSQMVAGLEAQRAEGYMVPLMRFGDYYLAVTPKRVGVGGWDGTGFPPVSAFHLTDSHTPWEQARGKTEPEGTMPKAVEGRLAEIRQDFPEADYNVEHGYLFRKADAFRDLNVPAVEKLMTLVGNDVRQQIRDQAKASGDPAAVKQVEQKAQDFYEQLLSSLRTQMYEELKAGNKRRAQVTPGYEKDFQKATGVYLNWAAGHTADLTHRDAIDRADAVIQGHPDRQVRAYWDAWNRRQDTPYTALDSGLAKARTATFLWLLGWNAATTAKIALHGPMLGVPMLTTGLGPSGRAMAAGSYFRTMADISKTLRLDSENGMTVDPMKAARTPDERAMLQHLEEIGTLHPAGADELAAIRRSGAETLDPQGKFSRRAVEIWSSNVRAADRTIRGAMALSAYRLAKDPQNLQKMADAWTPHDELFRALGPNPDPTAVARFFVDRSAGVWGEFGRMPVQRGALAGSMLQFRSYEMTYMSNLLNMMTRMGPEGKATAAIMMGSMGALAGAFGLPFAQDAKTGAEAVWKMISGIAPDLTTRITEAFDQLGGNNVVTEAFLHGLGRFMLGIDLGAGVGFGEALTGHANDPMAMVGPFASLAFGIPSRMMQRYRSEQPASAVIAEAMPNPIKNAIRGTIVYPDVGIQSTTGTQVLTPEQITGGGQLATALGFQTAAAARERERSEQQFRASEEQKAASALLSKGLGNLLWQHSLAQEQGDKTTADALQAEIEEKINAAVQGGAQRISMQALKRQMMQHLSPEETGMRRVPRAARPGAMTNPYVPVTPP